MLRLLYGPDLHDAVREAAHLSERSWLVSGFVKSGFMQVAGIDQTSNLQVFSRWRLSDLVLGGSDVSAAREVLTQGGDFFVHPRLHAKVFLFDDVAFVGSANLTCSGLPSFQKTGNIEAALATSKISEVAAFIESLREDSWLLNEGLVEEISSEVKRRQELQPQSLMESSSMMPEAFERIAREAQKRFLSGADFPWCEGPADVMIGAASDPTVGHDLELFSLRPNPSRCALRSSFLQSRCYAWLRSEAQSDVRFGELAARLHDALDGDPRPYRREVKRLLSNLLAWAIECDPNHFHEIPHRYTRSYRSVS